jgi:hypothetical protein
MSYYIKNFRMRRYENGFQVEIYVARFDVVTIPVPRVI